MLIYPSRNLWCIGKKNMLLLIDCDCKYVTSSFSRSLSISNVTVLSLNIPSEKSVLSTFYFTTVTLSTTFLFLSSNSTHNFFISVSNLSTFYFTSSSAASLLSILLNLPSIFFKQDITSFGEGCEGGTDPG